VKLPRWLLQHTATIEPYAGAGANGPVYADAVTVRCFREDKRRLVRSATGVDLGTRVATVITVADRDGGQLPVPSHVEVNLT
jgi:hypothetical protein